MTSEKLVRPTQLRRIVRYRITEECYPKPSATRPTRRCSADVASIVLPFHSWQDKHERARTSAPLLGACRYHEVGSTSES